MNKLRLDNFYVNIILLIQNSALKQLVIIIINDFRLKFWVIIHKLTRSMRVSLIIVTQVISIHGKIYIGT